MRLPVLSVNEPTVKNSFNLKQSTVNMLDQYAAMYQKQVGAMPQRKDLVEQMLLTFMREDKDFQKFLKAAEVNDI